jgi:predicted outer membrane repeat protein
LGVSTSFASEIDDAAQANNGTGIEPVSVSDEAMDDSSQENDMQSAGVEADANELSVETEDVLGDEPGDYNDLTNDLANVENGEVKLNRSYNVNRGTNINLYNVLTIDGQGNTIENMNYPNGKFVLKSGAEVTFKNIIFKNFPYSAIVVDASNAKIHVINCTFIDNIKTSPNPNSNFYGGAITFCQATSGNTFEDVQFIGNSLNCSYEPYSSGYYYYYYGGAILFRGSVSNTSFTNVNFTNNSASGYPTDFSSYMKYAGGAISFYGSASGITFSNCNFDGNFALSKRSDAYGGALYFNDVVSDVKFKDVNFTNNYLKAQSSYSGYPTLRGGAICMMKSTNNVSLENVNFKDNQAISPYYAYGGAIYCGNKMSNFTCFNVNFTDNYAISNYETKGGAIYFESVDTLSFNYTNFINNNAYDKLDRQSAAAYGGAMYVGYGDNFSFENSNFIENNAWGYYSHYYGQGALMYFSGIVNNMTFNNVNVSRSDSSSAILFKGRINNLKLNRFNASNNRPYYRTGGVFYFSSVSTVEITDSEFSNNEASSGCIFRASSSSSTFHISNVNFTNNSANEGGVISVYGSTVYLDNVNFINNFAAGSSTSYGGSILMSASTLYLNNVNFIGGHADYGGAIHSTGSSSKCYLDNVNFTDNYAKVGAAFDIREGQEFIFNNVNFFNNKQNMTFDYSSSDKNGGVVSVRSNPVITFNNSKFIGNDALNYGIILATYNSNLVFENVDFINNSAGWGGAIYYGSPTQSTFTNVNFINNSALYNGGAISRQSDTLSSDSNMIFDNVNFTNNSAKSGGAIYFMGETDELARARATFNHVKFDFNKALYGGAIYARNQMNFEDTLFINNSAECGGAVFIFSVDRFNIIDTKFINNSADYEGGAIYCYNGTYYDHIFYCEFIDNSAEFGGAIYATDNFYVIGCNFTGNYAENGSAIYVNSIEKPRGSAIEDSSFKKHSNALIEVNSQNRYDLQTWNCIFEDNDGDLFSLNNVCFLIDESEIINNKGRVVLSNYELTDEDSWRDSRISYSKITNNTCSGNGLINMNGGYAYIGSSEFTNNAADGDGLIYVNYSIFSIFNSSFTSNAAENGGVLFAKNSFVGMDEVNLTNNTASNLGGAIYVEGQYEFSELEYATIGDITFYDILAYNVILTENTADYGGAIYMAKDISGFFENISMVNNSAKFSGGAIFTFEGAYLELTSTNFTYNNAQEGSAIFNNGGVLNISDSVFLKNKANATFYMDVYDDLITVYPNFGDNCINAIYSLNRNNQENCFKNITYFDYINGICNCDDPDPQVNNITIEFYDDNGDLITTELISVYPSDRFDFIYDCRTVKVHVIEDDYYYDASAMYEDGKGDFYILQKLIRENTNGTLELTRNYTYTIGWDSIVEGIEIDKPLIINGNGYTIDALYKSRIFVLESDNISFYNINFANAYGDEGAFIFSASANNIEIENCSFKNSGLTFRTINGISICPDDEFDMEMLFEDRYQYLAFFENSVGYYGGAILIYGDELSIRNSNFTSISAGCGGFIYFEGDKLSISNSNFINSLAGYAGAIYANATTTIDNCRFSENIAGCSGGAILIEGSEFEIYDSMFNNTYAYGVPTVASNGGGGISRGVSQLDDFGGGAICIHGDNVTIVNDHFENSYSASIGGALYIDGANYLVDKSTFKNCSADEAGMETTSNMDALIRGLNGESSASPAPTEVASRGPSRSVTKMPYGGGAIYAKGQNLTVSDSTFESCNANSIGGAIYSESENTAISGSNFTKCYALSGGAVLLNVYAVNSSIVNCKFEDNNASLNGGAISWYADEGTLDNSIFNNNHVIAKYMMVPFNRFFEYYYEQHYSDIRQMNEYLGGGAVYWPSNNASISDSTFKNNSAVYRNGLVYDIYEGYIQFYHEYPEDDSGIIFIDTREFSQSLTFEEGLYGGALLITGVFINVTDTEFENNEARVGGAIALKNDYNPVMPVVPGESLEEKVSKSSKTPLRGDAEDEDTPIDTFEGYYVIIDKCSFIENSALYAGAIQVGGIQTGEGEYTLINNSRFYNNKAVIAGAVRLESCSNVIMNSAFDDNIAVIAGAVAEGYYILSSQHASYYDPDTGNTYWSYDGNGDPIFEDFVISTEDNLIENSTFNRNIAESAGAVLVLSNGTRIMNSDFTDNRIGNVQDIISIILKASYGTDQLPELEPVPGSVVVSTENTDYDEISDEIYEEIVDFIFSYLSEALYGTHYLVNQSQGGAINWIGFNGVIVDCDFAANTANYGGAIAWHNNGQIYNSTFTNNIAADKLHNETFEHYTFVEYTVSYQDVDPHSINGNNYLYQEDYNQMVLDVYPEVIANVSAIYGVDEDDITILLQTQEVPEYEYEGLYDITFKFVFQLHHNVTKTYGTMGYGGAIYWDCPGVMMNCTFNNNSADEGGAAYWINNDYSRIEDSRFYNNTAVLGGALFVNGDQIYVYNATFEGNRVFKKEIFNLYSTTYTSRILEVDISNELDGVAYRNVEEFNRAYFYSKVLLITQVLSPDYLLFAYTEDFIDYTALEPQVTTQQEISPLYESGEDYEGFTYEYIELRYGVRYDHYLDYYNGPASGGAIYCNGSGMHIQSSTFDKNIAECGGAIYGEEDSLTVILSNFTDNSAVEGGAIYQSGDNVIVDSAVFNKNNAEYGGAIYNSGNQNYVASSSFLNNTAKYGGAIYNSGYRYGIVYSSFFNNTAKYGGAVYAEGFTGILESEFRHNKAEMGSAVYVEYDTIYVESSVFLENQAKADSIDVSTIIDGNNVTLIATFRGNDNLINAFFVENEFEFCNVTYWSSQYGDSTNSDIADTQITSLEDGIDIIFDLISLQHGETIMTNVTNVNGQAIICLPVRSGRYYLLVTHEEDEYYTEVVGFNVLEVGKQESPINIDVEDIFYRENETVTITLNRDAVGNVTVWLNDEFYTADNLTDGKISFTISGLSAGKYIIDVLYNGSERYDSSSQTAEFNVKQINSTIAVAADNETNGTNVFINITVGPYDDLSGSVFVTIENEFGTSLTVNGRELQTVVKNLADGRYNVTAYYTGDNNYLSSSNSTDFVVIGSLSDAPVAYTIDVTIADISYLENATAYINISGKLNGVVTINVDNRTFTETVIDGAAIVNLTGLSGGLKTATVNFTSSDDNVKLATATRFMVNPLPTAVDVYVNGRNVTINVTEGATGLLTVYINGAKQEIQYTGQAVELNDVLAIGNNTILAAYAGNENYTESQNITDAPIDKNSPLVRVSADNIVYGSDAVIVVNVGEGQKGYVTINVNNTNYHAVIESTQIIFNIPGLTVDTYPVTVIYSGDETFKSEVNSTSFNVTKASLSTSATVVGQNITVNENSSFIIGVPSNFHGYVNITVDDKAYSGPIESVITMAKLAAGDKVADVTFWGDKNYEDFNLTTKFTVSRLITTLTVTVSDVTYPAGATAIIAVSGNATGKVIITINGKDLPVEDVINGQASIDLGVLSAGIKNLTARFTVTDSINNNATGETKFAVNKADTAVGIRTENNNVIVNVTDGATGKLTVYVNGNKKEFTFTGEEIIWEDILTVGNNSIIAIYDGNENYTGSQNTENTTIPKKSALVNVTADEIGYGEDAEIIVRVGDAQTGHVTITVNNNEYTSEIKDGEVTFIVPGLAAKEYAVGVKYSGDVNFMSAENDTTLIVNKAKLPVNVVGENVTVNDNTSFVINNVPSDFHGKVNITVDGITYSGNVSALIKMAKLSAGDKVANAVFYGDSNYEDLALNATFTVSRASATSATTLTVTVGDVTYGVNAIALVSVSGNANGTVVITVNGNEYNAVNVENGYANVDLGVLSAGIKNVTANFTVTDSFNNNATGATKFVVNHAPSAIEIIVSGRNVTVNVTEGTSANMTVYVNGVKYEYVYDGEAIELDNILVTGNNTIIAMYDGNENYTDAKDTKYEFIVKQAALVNVTADEITYGSDAVIVVKVGEGQTGHVTITLNNNEYTSEIKDGGATFVVPGLAAKEYSVGVKYSGDVNFTSAENDTTLIVNKANLNATVVGENVTVNDNTSFIINNVPDNFKGKVNITVDGITYSGDVSALIKMAKLTSGDKVADVVFYGDSNYNDLPLTAAFTVSRVSENAATTMTVTVNEVTYGMDATAVVTVSGNANGTVVITVNGNEYNAVKVENGQANVDLGVLSAGIKNVTARFIVSDLINNNATAETRFVVDKAPSNVNITVDGKDVAVNVTEGTQGNLTVYVNGVKYEFTYSGEIIELPNALITGNNTIIAMYDGNENYTDAKDTKYEFIAKQTASVNVTADAIVYGSDAIIVVKVGDDQTGYVTINVDNKEYTAEIKEGGATFAIHGLAAKEYAVGVKYSGDVNFTSAENDTTLIVNKANLNATVVGENVTVNDNTSFIINNVPDNFKGKVNITVDGITYSGDVSALIKMAKLTAGNKTAEVVFYGDSNYNDLPLTAEFTVSRISPNAVSAVVTVDDVSYGMNAVAIFTVSGNANGTVVIVVNGKEYPVEEVINGQATVDLGILAAGNKNVTAKFTVSDFINNNATAATKFTVKQSNSSVEINFNGANVTVKVTPGETGKLVVYVNGVENEFTYVGEAITIENALAIGDNSVIAIYDGSENYTGSQDAKNTTIPKKESFVTVTANNITYGSQEVITVSVPAGQEGYVTIVVDGKNQTSILKDGKATFNITGLKANSYDVTVTYNGNENYNVSENKTTFVVNKADLNAIVIGQNVTDTDNSSFVVSVPDDFTGKVNITVDGISYSGDALALITMDKLTAGDKVASVTFWNDSNYNDLTLDAPFNVSHVDSFEITSIKADNMTRGWNSEFDYQAAFLNKDGSALANTEVKFIVNGKEYNATTNEDGIAHLIGSKLDVGTYNITSVNPVTKEQLTTTVNIVKRITENSDLVMDYRDGSKFVVKVFGDDGNIAPEGEIISIYANGVYYVAKVDSKGYARITINLLPKTYTIVAEYKGFKTSNKLTVKQILKPLKKTTKVKKSKKSFKLKASLKFSNGKPLVGKVITFKIKGKTLKAKTNKKGIATVKVKKKTFKKLKLKKGKKYKVVVAYTIKEKYGNDIVPISDRVKCYVKIKK